jgi:hypothetical protein
LVTRLQPTATRVSEIKNGFRIVSKGFTSPEYIIISRTYLENRK